KAAHQLASLARRWQAKARELVFREAREVGNVGREVGGHAERADLVGEAEAPVVLHGARLGGVRLRIERGAGLLVEDEDAYAGPAELVREHQPAGAAADDHDLGGLRKHAGESREEVPKALADPG